jgi:histidine triad (HIT) family protein
MTYGARRPANASAKGVRVADCAFCRIVAAVDAGSPDAAEVVHADDASVAFLDHRPLFHGHTLVVPRRHVVTYADLPPETVEPFFRIGQRLERAVESAMGADGSLVLMNNVVSQSVPHLHLHVIPRRFKDGLRFWLGPRVRYGGAAPSAAEVAAAIRAALAGAP